MLILVNKVDLSISLQNMEKCRGQRHRGRGQRSREMADSLSFCSTVSTILKLSTIFKSVQSLFDNRTHLSLVHRRLV